MTDDQQHNQQQQPGQVENHDDEQDDDEEEYEGQDREYSADRAKPYKKPGKKPHRPPKMSKQDQQYKMEFNMLDLDNSGSVDKAELKKCFMGYVPDSILDKIIKALDTNRDGKISFAEYRTVRKIMGSVPLPMGLFKKNDGTAATKT